MPNGANDTIFFAGLATKKTRPKKLHFYIEGMDRIASAQLWCINNPGRPKAVRVTSALLYQAYDYHEIPDDLFYPHAY